LLAIAAADPCAADRLAVEAGDEEVTAGIVE